MIVLAVLGSSSVALNIYLWQRSVTVSVEAPSFNSQYQDLLKRMPEAEAQDALIRLIEDDPRILSVGRSTSLAYPGLRYEYCDGNGGTTEDSWDNLKTN